MDVHLWMWKWVVYPITSSTRSHFFFCACLHRLFLLIHQELNSWKTSATVCPALLLAICRYTNAEYAEHLYYSLCPQPQCTMYDIWRFYVWYQCWVTWCWSENICPRQNFSPRCCLFLLCVKTEQIICFSFGERWMGF